MSKLKASPNLFKKTMSRHYYLTHMRPPAVRRKKVSAEEVTNQLKKRSRPDSTASTRTVFDKIYLGL